MSNVKTCIFYKRIYSADMYNIMKTFVYLVAVEHFYSTLATVHMETYEQQARVVQRLSERHIEELNMFKMRATFWAGEYSHCQGKVRREICNLALGDLGNILSAQTFVVNKEKFH